MKKLAPVLAAVAVALSACATPGGNPTGTSDPEGPAAIDVKFDVEYYPACGNEELVYDGVHWYQEHPEADGPNYDAEDVWNLDEASLGSLGKSRSVGTVIAPGPGDDVGTLVIYDNGTAHWESNSGDLEAWLTTEVRTYNWVC